MFLFELQRCFWVLVISLISILSALKKRKTPSRIDFYEKVYLSYKDEVADFSLRGLSVLSVSMLRTPFRSIAFNKKLIDLIFALYNKDNDKQEAYFKIICFLEQKYKGNPPVDILLEISRICISSKNYTLALKARDKALKSMLMSKCDKKKILAFFELGELGEINKIMEVRKLPTIKDRNIWMFFQWLSRGSIGRNNSPFLFKKKKYLENGDLFYNEIKNKRVAIVGPVESNVDQSKEIDSYDIVIRFNYLGKRRLSTSNLGEKIDISYYNDEIMKKMSKFNMVEISKLLFVVLKKINKNSSEVIKNARAYRCFKNKNRMTINGTFNAVPNALLDVICFLPKEVKVFGVDLFLTRDYRMSYLGEKPIDTSRSFLWHDPITQYRMIDVLYKNGFIKVDTRLEKILSLGCERYLNDLERIWRT